MTVNRANRIDATNYIANHYNNNVAVYNNNIVILNIEIE